MSARLGMPVEVWNAFENPLFDTIHISPDTVENEHPIYSVSLGLALKETYASNSGSHASLMKAA